MKMDLTNLLVCLWLLVATASAKKAVVCENYQAEIRCPGTKLIQIRKADYGRVDNTECRNGHYDPNWPQMNPQHTCARNVKQNVQLKCQNKMYCNLMSNNGEFGDPCVGIYKLLTVDYICKKPDPNKGTPPMALEICEHKSAEVSCPPGKMLDIIRAVYGRTNNLSCPGPYGIGSVQLNNNTNCKAKVGKKVRASCQGQNKCTVQSNNGVYGDPCRGTYKYLQLKYACLTKEEMEAKNNSAMPKAKVKGRVICEHYQKVLLCKDGKKINIKKAFYGRVNNRTCPGRYGLGSAQLQKTDCKRDTMQEVTQACQGQEKCTVVSNNGAYGDPCVGTYKYLQVRFTCEMSA